MSTGQTSSSLRASSTSPLTSSATSTSIKVPSASAIELLLNDVRDLVDALDDRDAGGLEAGDLLGRRVLLALHDRAGVAEGHSLHLLVVHELARHERDDRQAGVVL